MFDFIVNKGEHRQYAGLYGSQTIVFIKPGRGGTAAGRDDKYLKIAQNLRQKFGCTVICSSNLFDVPVTDHLPFTGDMLFVERFVMERGLDDFDLYYFGNSDGALRCLRQCWSSKVQRALLLNPPLGLDMPGAINGVKNFIDQSMRIVVGSLDPSASLARLLAQSGNPRVSVEILDGVDHDFTGAQDLFASLPERLFS
ncbi:MAG: hypothetical protein IK015_08800 [Treponema sp.]|nr:hypothetical protein [Treponema sp.]